LTEVSYGRSLIACSCAYSPFCGTRSTSGGLNTDKKFTGQRLDQLDLYFYNARYYDPGIGRFISADTVVPNWTNPQSLNRYSYCLNNPLKYVDPSGHWWETAFDFICLSIDACNFLRRPTWAWP